MTGIQEIVNVYHLNNQRFTEKVYEIFPKFPDNYCMYTMSTLNILVDKY